MVKRREKEKRQVRQAGRKQEGKEELKKKVEKRDGEKENENETREKEDKTTLEKKITIYKDGKIIKKMGGEELQVGKSVGVRGHPL